MRKRNFKRIISLLLTVAMVFTMNTGVFADEPISSDTVVTAETAEEPTAEAADPSTAAEGAGDETGAAAAAETETTGEEVTGTVTDGAAESETKAAGEAEKAAENESAEVSETQTAAEVQEEVAETVVEETVSPDEVTETVSPDEATVSPDGAEATVSPDEAGTELSAQASVKSGKTVSGLTITYADGGASVDYEDVSANGGETIYTTINIKSGTAGVYGTVYNPTDDKKEHIVSINIASGATMMAGAEIYEDGDRDLNYWTVPQKVNSFTGDGTIIYSNSWGTMSSNFGKGLSIGRFYGSEDGDEHATVYYYESYIREISNNKYYLLAGEDNNNKAIAVSSLVSGEDSSIELEIGGYGYTYYENRGKGSHHITDGGVKVPSVSSKKIFKGGGYGTIKVLDEPSHTLVDIDKAEYTVSATTISGTSVAYGSYILYTEDNAPRIMYVYPQLSNVLGSTTINSGAIGMGGLYMNYLADTSLKKKLGLQEHDSKYYNNKYQFTLSTNSSGIDEFEDDWTGNSVSWNYSSGELKVDEIIDGSSYEDGKIYYLYGRVTQGTRDYIQYYHYKDDDGEWDYEGTGYESVIGYPSEPVVMGSFTVPAKDGKLTMTYNSSVKSYYAGELGDDVYMDKAKTILGVPSGYSIMNNGALTWSFSGTRAGSLKAEENGEAKTDKDTGVTTYTGYGDRVLKVVDSDGAEVGTVKTLFVISKNGVSKNDVEQFVDWQNNVEGSKKPDKYDDFVWSSTNNPYELTPGTYFAYSNFEVFWNYQVYYNNMYSNPVEVKIEKAAIDVQPDVQTKISGDSINSSDYLVTSKYTGVKINSYTLSGNALVLDGKAYSGEALTAGSHTFAISANYVKSDNYYTLTSDGATYGAAQTFTVIGDDALSMELSLDTAKQFYYGNGLERVNGNYPNYFLIASNTLKQGSTVVGKVGTDYQVDYDTLKYTAYEDEKLTKEKVLDTSAKLAAVSANSQIYIQATAKVNGKDVSSNVVSVTVQQRPVTLANATNKSYTKWNEVASDRGAAALVSVNSASVNVILNTDEYGKFYNSSGTEIDVLGVDNILKSDVKTLPLKSSMLTAGQLDKSNKSYYIQLEDISSLLDEAKAGSFSIAGSKILYTVNPVYYIRYVLEYDNSVRQSSEVIRYDSTSINKAVSINLARTVSDPGAFPNVTLHDGDILYGWDAYYNNESIYKKYGETYKVPDDKNEKFTLPKEDITAMDDDIYLHAVIKGVAGSDGDVNTLFVTSINPVVYSGKPHVDALYYDKKDLPLDYKKDNDLGTGGNGIKVTDTSNGGDKSLVEGVHYTLTYKNNINASVGFKNSTDATGGVTQLYTNDSKRPQVIIKGKGEYKGINVTVYYDIYPKNLNTADNYYMSAENMAITGYNVDDETTEDFPLFFYKKGKNINYKFNVWDYRQWDKDKKNKFKDKKTTLKAKKDYEFVIQKKVDTNATHELAWNDDDVKAANGKVVWETIGSVNQKAKIKDEGTYRIWVTGINNYTGHFNKPSDYTFEVKDAKRFDSYKFSFLKSLKWSTELPLTETEKMVKDNYKLVIKNGKGKKATEVSMNAANVPGYVIKGLKIQNPNKSKENPTADAADFANAGKYQVVLGPSPEYSKANSVYGTKTINVALKGYALKASDFVLEDMKKLTYDGTSKAPVIKLKDNKKITAYAGYANYMSRFAGGDSFYVKNNYAYGYIRQGLDKDGNTIVPGFDWYDNVGYFFAESFKFWDDNDEKWEWTNPFNDNWKYTQTGPNRYKIYYEPNNDEPGEYKVNIYAWGPFAESKKIELKYKRSPMSLKAAVEAGIVQIAQTPGVQGYDDTWGIPQANINGTFNARFTVSLNEVKDGKSTLIANKDDVYYWRTADKKMGYDWVDGMGIGITKFSGNNKATTDAKATFVCDKTARVYFTGTYTLPAFTIAPKIVRYDNIGRNVYPLKSYQGYDYDTDSYYEYYEGGDKTQKYESGSLYVDVKDVVSTNKSSEKAPKITIYQADKDGKKLKKLKVKTDYLRADEWTALSDNKTRKTGWDIAVSVNNAEATKGDKGASTITFLSYNSAAKKNITVTKTVKGSFYFQPDATRYVQFTRGIKVSPKDITFTMSTNGVSGNKWTFIGEKIGLYAKTVNSQYPTSLDVKINGTTVNYFVSANGSGDPISSNSVYIAMKGDKTPYKQQKEGTLKNTDKDYLVYDALCNSYYYDFRDDAKVGKKSKITVILKSDPTGTIPLIGSKTMTFEIVRPTNKGLTL